MNLSQSYQNLVNYISMVDDVSRQLQVDVENINVVDTSDGMVFSIHEDYIDLKWVEFIFYGNASIHEYNGYVRFKLPIWTTTPRMLTENELYRIYTQINTFG